MSKHKRKNKLFEGALVKQALKQSFIKLSPRSMFRNPVMFTVYLGTIIMLAVCIWIAAGETSQGSLVYNSIVFAADRTVCQFCRSHC